MNYITKQRIDKIRSQNQGVALGVILTKYLTDREIAIVVEARDKLSSIHNTALNRATTEDRKEYMKELK
jgi:hypothetical protein